MLEERLDLEVQQNSPRMFEGSSFQGPKDNREHDPQTQKKRIVGVESTTEISNEAAAPLFQHLGQVSTTSSGAQQPAEKTAEQLEQENIEKEQKAKERPQKKQQEVELLKKNRTKTWVDMLAKKIESVKMKIAQTNDTETQIEATTRAVYNKRLHKHVEDLSALRAAFESVRVGGNDQEITDAIANGPTIADGVKGTFIEWTGGISAHKRVGQKNNRAVAKAAAAATAKAADFRDGHCICYRQFEGA